MRTFLLLLAAANSVPASCQRPSVPRPICLALERTEVSFIGTVLETNRDDRWKKYEWYRFSVEEHFEGLDKSVKEVIVSSPYEGTVCGTVSKGKRYLIASSFEAIVPKKPTAVELPSISNDAWYLPRGVLVWADCPSILAVEDATGFIRHFRRILAGLESAGVLGSVSVTTGDSSVTRPVSGAVVQITGRHAARFVTTDANGCFEIGGLDPGWYHVTAGAPGFSPPLYKWSVEVKRGKCSDVSLALESLASLSGTVLQHSGAPAKGVPVEYRDRIVEKRFVRCVGPMAVTDREGRFRIRGVPPGEYLVGVNINCGEDVRVPFIPTYLPGAATPDKAQLVRLRINEHKDGLSIRLPPPLPVRTVRVKVVWPDGRPASGAVVRANIGIAEYHVQAAGPAGVAEFPLLSNKKYLLRAQASVNPPATGRRGPKPVLVETGRKPLPPGSSPAEVLLRLNDAQR